MNDLKKTSHYSMKKSEIKKQMYGKICMIKTYCGKCETETFVIDGEKKCCGEALGKRLLKKLKKESL